jgi:hypothetical protein
VAAIESPLNIRITSSAEVDPSTLRPHPDNWRRHPNAQLGALEGALSEIGWVAPVTVNQTTGHMLDGHARVKIAIERGEALVPVNYVELTEAEELLFLATFDPLAEMAGTHAKELEAILERIGDVRSSHLDVLLDALRRRAGLAAKILTSRRGIGTQIDVTPFEMGEIRTLGHDGAHRVMCGDSTDREAVGRLLATIEPTLLVADPPTEGDEDVESAESTSLPRSRRSASTSRSPSPGSRIRHCTPAGITILSTRRSSTAGSRVPSASSRAVASPPSGRSTAHGSRKSTRP